MTWKVIYVVNKKPFITAQWVRMSVYTLIFINVVIFIYLIMFFFNSFDVHGLIRELEVEPDQPLNSTISSMNMCCMWHHFFCHVVVYWWQNKFHLWLLIQLSVCLSMILCRWPKNYLMAITSGDSAQIANPWQAAKNKRTVSKNKTKQKKNKL